MMKNELAFWQLYLAKVCEGIIKLYLGRKILNFNVQCQLVMKQ